MDELLRKYYFLAGRLHHVNDIERDEGGNAVGCSCGWLSYGIVKSEYAVQVGRRHIEDKAREIYYHFEGRVAP
jgi:hypothetical protein